MLPLLIFASVFFSYPNKIKAYICNYYSWTNYGVNTTGCKPNPSQPGCFICSSCSQYSWVSYGVCAASSAAACSSTSTTYFWGNNKCYGRNYCEESRTMTYSCLSAPIPTPTPTPAPGCTINNCGSGPCTTNADCCGSSGGYCIGGLCKQADGSCGGGGNDPIGWHDGTDNPSCTTGGWTCDADNYSTALTVKFYTNINRTNRVIQGFAGDLLVVAPLPLPLLPLLHQPAAG
ncbi:MAG: hypothetical protein UY06_C0003G0002 [Candidatus Amesbacteria bacterium GW2011_GWA2_47_70]|nr:MAG: hypothetical protein UY06_C0003G0002 [Candidatus Amesbacteria bacterium GW2011_GWA2_47_70]